MRGARHGASSSQGRALLLLTGFGLSNLDLLIQHVNPLVQCTGQLGVLYDSFVCMAFKEHRYRQYLDTHFRLSIFLSNPELRINRLWIMA